eukprot:7346180-Alexandrium_andersonii.AAC.1
MPQLEDSMQRRPCVRSESFCEGVGSRPLLVIAWISKATVEPWRKDSHAGCTTSDERSTRINSYCTMHGDSTILSSGTSRITSTRNRSRGNGGKSRRIGSHKSKGE